MKPYKALGAAQMKYTQESYRIAGQVFEMGANVIPMSSKEKSATKEWKGYQTIRQATLEDKAWRYDFTDTAGIINGFNNWRSIDIDAKKNGDGTKKPVADKVIYTILQKMGLPQDYSWVSRSVSGTGFHIWFLSDGNLPPYESNDVVWIYPNEAYDTVFDHIELRWNRCLTMLPARNSQWFNETPIHAPVHVNLKDILDTLEYVGTLPQIKPLALISKRKHDIEKSRRAVIQHIKEKLIENITDIAEEHLDYDVITTAGKNEIKYGGNGGLWINQENGEWYNFSTERGGDVIDFIGYITYGDTYDRYNNEMFIKVLEQSAKLAGVSLSQLQRVSNGERLDPKDIADKIKDGYSDQIAYDGIDFREYNGIYWETIPQERIEVMTTQVMTELEMFRTPKTVSDVIWFLRQVLKRDIASRGLVAFTNGVLEDGALRPHKAEDYLPFALDYPYEPNNTAVYINTLLSDVIDDPVAIEALKTHIGLSLLGETSFRKTLLLIGPPLSLKSTILNLVLRTLGQPADVFAPGTIFARDREASLQRAVWRDKPIIAMDEFHSQSLKDEEPFKLMSDHRGIESRLHNRTPINLPWKPKMIMATNNNPEVRDSSGAVKSRLVLIQMKETTIIEAKSSMLRKIESERGAFAAECLTAAYNAIETGDYPISDKMMETYDEVATEGDPLKAFVAEEALLTVKTNEEYSESSAALYKAYQDYCEDNGIKYPMTQTAFSRKLIAYAPWKLQKKHTMNGNVVQGIRLINQPEPQRPHFTSSMKRR